MFHGDGSISLKFQQNPRGCPANPEAWISGLRGSPLGGLLWGWEIIPFTENFKILGCCSQLVQNQTLKSCMKRCSLSFSTANKKWSLWEAHLLNKNRPSQQIFFHPVWIFHGESKNKVWEYIKQDGFSYTRRKTLSGHSCLTNQCEANSVPKPKPWIWAIATMLETQIQV